MRITGGTFRGRNICTPSGNEIRPATDRVRETIFNILQNYIDLADQTVADLYAGTGSLGFECLSRGSAFAAFVDHSESSMRLIRKTAQTLGCTGRCSFIRADARSYLSNPRISAGLIFADPPYALPDPESLPRLIADSTALREDGIFLIEHDKRTSYPESGSYTCFRRRQFGDTVVSFFSRTQTGGSVEANGSPLYGKN